MCAGASDPYTLVFEQCAESISNVLFLPHLNGAETPIQDADSACCVVHLRANTTFADITRGLLNSLAYEMRQNLQALTAIGCEAQEIRAIGGGCRSDRLLQIKADVTQLPITRMAAAESSALGAAMIAAVGTGVFSSYEQAAAEMVHPGKRFEPNPKLAAIYQERFEEYMLLYSALRPVNHAIAARLRPVNHAIAARLRREEACAQRQTP